MSTYRSDDCLWIRSRHPGPSVSNSDSKAMWRWRIPDLRNASQEFVCLWKINTRHCKTEEKQIKVKLHLSKTNGTKVNRARTQKICTLQALTTFLQWTFVSFSFKFTNLGGEASNSWSLFSISVCCSESWSHSWKQQILLLQN